MGCALGRAGLRCQRFLGWECGVPSGVPLASAAFLRHLCRSRAPRASGSSRRPAPAIGLQGYRSVPGGGYDGDSACVAVPGSVGRDASAVASRSDASRSTFFFFSADRKSVVAGKSVSVRVDLGGRRIIKKKKKKENNKL